MGLILTGDFNFRSSLWWEDDAENPEGTALDELIETNDLYQLINEPTNIRDESMNCIDFIITDQPNFFVESGVSPSLDEHCQHQIIYGKLNLSIPAPPPYRRTIRDYSTAETNKTRDVIYSIDWSSLFQGQGSNGMVDIFTDTLFSVSGEYFRPTARHFQFHSNSSEGLQRVINCVVSRRTEKKKQRKHHQLAQLIKVINTLAILFLVILELTKFRTIKCILGHLQHALS